MNAVMLEDRLAAIEAKLDALAPRFEGRTRGRPAEGAIAALERAEGVRLPEEHRALLLRVGDGAPGLLPLARWGEALMDEAPLREACPLDPSKGYDDYGDDDEPAQGAIALTAGTPHALLVVSGARRGQVMYFDPDSYWSETVEDARGQPVDSLVWYAAWLDASGPAAPADAPGGSTARRLAEGLLGGEDALVQALRRPDADARHRRKAVVGLGEQGSLGSESLAALEGAADDPSPPVRQEVLRAIHRHAGPRAAERLARFQHDPSPSVRRELVRQIGADSHGHGLLRALVDDDDDPTVFGALAALLRTGPTGDELAQLLARPSVRRAPDALGLLMHALGETTDPRWLPELVGLLDHDRAPTRLVAAVALRTLGSADACGPLRQRRSVEPAANVRTAIERALEALGCPEPSA